MVAAPSLEAFKVKPDGAPLGDVRAHCRDVGQNVLQGSHRNLMHSMILQHIWIVFFFVRFCSIYSFFSHSGFLLSVLCLLLPFHLQLVIMFCSVFIKYYPVFPLITGGVPVLSKINLLVLFVLVFGEMLLLHVFWLIYLLVLMLIWLRHD